VNRGMVRESLVVAAATHGGWLGGVLVVGERGLKERRARVPRASEVEVCVESRESMYVLFNCIRLDP